MGIDVTILQKLESFKIDANYLRRDMPGLNSDDRSRGICILESTLVDLKNAVNLIWPPDQVAIIEEELNSILDEIKIFSKTLY